MATVTTTPATLDDLMRTEGKAELIGGRIVHFMAAGRVPGRVAKRILFSLDRHEQVTKSGEALGDNVGYAIRPPLQNGRESFNPDASFYSGSSPYGDDGFIFDAPTFAVEIRSKSDFGRTADREYSEKRDDYFAAGTLAVWDVDYKAETVKLYRQSDPLTPLIFGRGDMAHAEPAVPGWRVAVDDIFS